MPYKHRKRGPASLIKTVKSIAKIPGKVISTIENKYKDIDEAKRAKNKKMIEDNWGSVENYEELMKAQSKLKAKKK